LQATTSSFVDDNVITITSDSKTPGKETLKFQQKIIETSQKIDDYLNSNCLAANQDKNQLMIVSQHPQTKYEITIPNQIKDIKHTTTLNILGTIFHETLKWNTYLTQNKESLLNQLKSRTNSLKLLRKHSDTKFSKILANGIVQGKLMYSMEVWGGAPAYVIKKLQSAQLESARVAIGHRSKWWSTSRLLNEMGWLSVSKLCELTVNKMTHRILQTGKPELLAQLMTDTRTTPHATRSQTHHKLGPIPRDLGRTAITRATY
jgi:hypothetical protein